MATGMSRMTIDILVVISDALMTDHDTVELAHTVEHNDEWTYT